MRPRKKAVAIFLTILGSASIGYHLSAGASLEVFYALCGGFLRKRCSGFRLSQRKLATV